MAGHAIDLTGQVFSRLTVVSRAENRGREVFWNCRCECGNSIAVRAATIKNGATKSCGCLANELSSKRMAERNLTHGATIGCREKGRQGMTLSYRAWDSMKSRTTHPRQKCYEGVFVCDRWINSYENFLADMGEPPGEGYQIDRINNEKGYSPDNCRWVTAKENCRNKTNNRVIEWNGESRCLKEWQEILSPQLGTKPAAIYRRIYSGWSVEKAFTTPHRSYKG